MTCFAPRFTVLGLCSFALLGGLAAQERAAKPSSTSQIEAMNKLYAELLEVVKQHRVDARRDDLRQIHEKRQAVSSALDAFALKAKELMFDRRHLGLDYVRFSENTFPRLTGRVVEIGPDAQWENLDAALGEIQAGDVVLLGEGEFHLPRSHREWRDIAFVGLGPEKTTMTGEFEQARRLRLTALKFDCRNNEFLDLRSGGAVQIQKCLITNYNSGAGGSNSVFGTGTSLLIEDSTFEGLSGRQAKSGSGGDAFDLRGDNFLYVRNSKFKDNDEIVRATSLCVFDRCRSESNRDSSGILPYDTGFVLVRDNRCKIRGKASAEFKFATDDLDVVRYLMDKESPLDDGTKTAVAALGLRDNPRYWATLLHHPNEEVQFIAQGRLAALLRSAMPNPRVATKVTNRVPKEMRKPFAAALRSSRALQWLEDNEPKLVWNEKLRAYELVR